jgi:hypothetical protein
VKFKEVLCFIFISSPDESGLTFLAGDGEKVSHKVEEKICLKAVGLTGFATLVKTEKLNLHHKLVTLYSFLRCPLPSPHRTKTAQTPKQTET